MRNKVAACLLGVSLAAFAQSDRGTITGTVVDPAGALVASAAIEVRSVQTGAIYQVGTSGTGNYTVEVPTGRYEVSVTAAGFKRYVRPNIVVPVEQTLRIDANLEIGSNTEAVTVTDAAPLLKTESGELSHNVTSDTLNNLPVLGIGNASVGATGIRSVYSVTTMLPGNTWLPDNSIRINVLRGTPKRASGGAGRHRHRRRWSKRNRNGLYVHKPTQRRSGSRGCGADQQLCRGVRAGGRRSV